MIRPEGFRGAAFGSAGERCMAISAVVAVGDVLSFVYKAAAEIGELGDNTAVLRAAIADDDLLARAIAGPDARAVVLGDKGPDGRRQPVLFGQF